MNTEPTMTHQQSETGKDLGSAIASAISARVEPDPQPPPVSRIVDQAAARARVRTVQRTVVGIAASVTLLAGGIVAFNVFERDGMPSTVATEPTITADTAIPSPETEPTADIGLNQDALAPLVFNEQDPAELFPAGFFGFGGIETVGDGRVVARAHGESGTALIITDNGEDWTRIELPDGVSPDVVDVSGPRWLLTTLDFDGPSRVFYSDDEGADWTEVQFDPAPEGELLTALASRQNLVIVFKIPPDRTAHSLLIQELIAAEGLIPDDAALESWTLQGSTISFTTTPASDTYSFEVSDETLTALDASVGETQTRVYSSDGGPATVTAEHESWHTTGSSNADGFYIALTTPTDELLTTSADGVDWSEASIDSLSMGAEMTTRLGDWFVSRNGQALTVQSLNRLLDPAADPTTIPGMQSLVSLESTPTATVAVAYPSTDDSDQPTPRIGWSRHQSEWNWQSPSEAFGINEDEASIAVALGDGYVIAHVTGFASNTTGLEAQSPRWFKATVQ